MDPALILQGILLQHSSLIEVNLGATIPPRLAFLPLGSGFLHMAGVQQAGTELPGL